MANAYHAINKKQESLVYFEKSFSICRSDIIESRCIEVKCELGIKVVMPKGILSKLVYLQYFPDLEEIQGLELDNGSAAYLKGTQLNGVEKTKALLFAMSDGTYSMQVKDELGIYSLFDSMFDR